MTELNVSDFDTFFEELWKKPSFAWQRELAQRALEKETPWPEVIALPTASGKTACMDIAVFALAAQVNRRESGLFPTAPRRIFFVVDRRIIVDEAFERAKILSYNLKNAKNGKLKEIADRLRKLSGGNEPLACFQLRGGMYRSDAWARSPLQPIIVATTVDQLGSRLLFRGYGRSFKTWPIHAGLVGNDSLIFLDEAHCSQPFLETLQAIGKYRTWGEASLNSPFHVVIMSATPPAGISDVFRDESCDPIDISHPLGKRQQAEKLAKLQPAKAKGKNATIELAKELVQQTEYLLKSWIEENLAEPNLGSQAPQSAPATVIFCNRVDTAREAHRHLAHKYGDRAILMTGRMRPIDKDDTISDTLTILGADQSDKRSLDKPLFVIATQSLEVGANLDFDLLVTECAALDALRQRFGRLNRMGRTIKAKAVILIRADQSENSEEDPVYGAALAETWKWLNSEASANQEINMGFAAISNLLPTEEALKKLNTPSGHAPVMLPAHIDILCQTAPEPLPTPEVSLFLHGPRSGPADVQICWRSDLTGNDEESWKDAVILCPPASPECLAVPYGLMRRWLSGDTIDSSADIEGVADIVATQTDEKFKRKVIRWRGRDDVEVTENGLSIRPGDVVVIPASLSGWEILATLGNNPIADWGDRAFLQARDRAILRLHPDVLKQWEFGSLNHLKTLAYDGPALLNDDPEKLREEINVALDQVIADVDFPKSLAWLWACAQSLSPDCKIILHPTEGLMLLGRYRLNQYVNDSDSFCDEDEQIASGITVEPLEEHLKGVADLAGSFANGCSLPVDLCKTIETAGRYHDLGKADPRFQAWLKGGNPWVQGPLLAKSKAMPQGRKESEVARKRAGYPAGGRHELLSVRLLESNPASLPVQKEMCDLLLHLLASHHGYCRPFAPAVEDFAPANVKLNFQGIMFSANTATKLEMLDSGVPERFWQLTRRYGWWGLAWLEAIMRLADHRRSEWEELQGKNR